MLTIQRIKSLLHYNPETGEFTWLERKPSDFKANWICYAWNARFSGKPAGTVNHGYISIWIDGKGRQAHRLAFLFMTGSVPPMVDHRDRVKTNNAWDNLRCASMKHNRANTNVRRGNTSGFKGVSFHRREGKYRARIGISGTVRQIGNFDCPREAAKAYDEVAIVAFGEYALTNKMMGLV